VSLGIQIAVASVLLVVLAVAADRAAARANSEALAAQTRMQLDRGSLFQGLLRRLDQDLEAQLLHDPLNVPLWLQRAQVQIKWFRFEEAVRLAMSEPISLEEAYDRTDLDRQRREDCPGPLAGLSHLELARDMSIQTLKICPLSDSARWNLTRLDFAVTNPADSPKRLAQILRLRGRTPESLGKIAAAAAASGDWSTARATWKQQLTLSPRFVGHVIDQVKQTGGAVRLSQVIPEDRELVLAAARS